MEKLTENIVGHIPPELIGDKDALKRSIQKFTRQRVKLALDISQKIQLLDGGGDGAVIIPELKDINCQHQFHTDHLTSLHRAVIDCCENMSQEETYDVDDIDSDINDYSENQEEIDDIVDCLENLVQIQLDIDLSIMVEVGSFERKRREEMGTCKPLDNLVTQLDDIKEPWDQVDSSHSFHQKTLNICKPLKTPGSQLHEMEGSWDHVQLASSNSGSSSMSRLIQLLCQDGPCEIHLVSESFRKTFQEWFTNWHLQAENNAEHMMLVHLFNQILTQREDLCSIPCINNEELEKVSVDNLEAICSRLSKLSDLVDITECHLQRIVKAHCSLQLKKEVAILICYLQFLSSHISHSATLLRKTIHKGSMSQDELCTEGSYVPQEFAIFYNISCPRIASTFGIEFSPFISYSGTCKLDLSDKDWTLMMKSSNDSPIRKVQDYDVQTHTGPEAMDKGDREGPVTQGFAQEKGLQEVDVGLSIYNSVQIHSVPNSISQGAFGYSELHNDSTTGQKMITYTDFSPPEQRHQGDVGLNIIPDRQKTSQHANSKGQPNICTGPQDDFHKINSHLEEDQAVVPSGKALCSQAKDVVHSGKALYSQDKAVVHPGKALCSPDKAVVHSGKALCSQDKAVIPSGKAFCSQDKDVVHSGKDLCSQDNAVVHSGKALCNQDKAVVHSGKDLCNQDKAVVHSEKVLCSQDKTVVHSEKALCSQDKTVVHSGKALCSQDKTVSKTPTQERLPIARGQSSQENAINSKKASNCLEDKVGCAHSGRVLPGLLIARAKPFSGHFLPFLQQSFTDISLKW